MRGGVSVGAERAARATKANPAAAAIACDTGMASSGAAAGPACQHTGGSCGQMGKDSWKSTSREPAANTARCEAVERTMASFWGRGAESLVFGEGPRERPVRGEGGAWIGGHALSLQNSFACHAGLNPEQGGQVLSSQGCQTNLGVDSPQQGPDNDDACDELHGVGSARGPKAATCFLSYVHTDTRRRLLAKTCAW